MTELKFTHLTTGKPVGVTRELVFGIMDAPALKGTYILGNGGAVMPVQEQPDMVRAKVYGTPNEGNHKPTQKGSRSK